MIAQIVLGFMTTDALSRGDHDTVIALGAAHAAVGVAIPVVMLEPAWRIFTFRSEP